MVSVYFYFGMTIPKCCIIFGLYYYLVKSKNHLRTLNVIVNVYFIGHYKV